MPTRIPRGRGRGRGGATSSARQPSDTAAPQDTETAVAIDAVTPKQEDDDDEEEEEDEAKPPTTSENTPTPIESLQSATAAGYVLNYLQLYVQRAESYLPVQQRPHKMPQTRLSVLRCSDLAA
jgi:hypothetical protein